MRVAAEGIEPSRNAVMGRASRRGSLRLEREPCCTGLAERMKLGWELGRPFPRRACSESNRGQQGSKPRGRIRRHKRRDARSGKRVGLEPGSRTQRSRYRKPKPASGGSSRRPLCSESNRERPGSEPGAWIRHDREKVRSPGVEPSHRA